MSHRSVGLGANVEIVEWLVSMLVAAAKPVPRDVLAAQLAGWYGMEFGTQWTTATAARRLREAINEAIRDGHPVVSVGTGLALATDPDQRRTAAERLRKAARRLWMRADRLDGIPVSGEPVQQEMWAGAVS